jgi:glycosyltransferase involved in cell wall biosynthesis
MMRAVAVVVVRNGELHVRRCISDLIANNIEVVLIDHASDDQSVKIARKFLGRGLLSIEHLPWSGLFSLRSQLEAKAQVVGTLPHEWVLHVDVDEWLCAPWQHTTLFDAIRRVDAAGFNCINFDEMTFVAWPHEDFCQPDYAQQMTTYYFFEPNRLRLMRAWRRATGLSNVELAGHGMTGPIKVFPINFVLRHYLALSSEYVFRKYADRVFAPEELALGWHNSPEVRRIGITRQMCMLRPSRHLKTLRSSSSFDFDRTDPASTHYWQWP